MKKLLFLTCLLLIIADFAFAKRSGVFMEFHRKSNPQKNTEVNRSPMHLPVDVFYDSETHKIEVISYEAIDAEIFLFDINGVLKHYSSSLNVNFTVSDHDIYIILIQGPEWYAEGKIEVESEIITRYKR